MYISEIIVDLYESGYNCYKIRKYILDMYGMKVEKEFVRLSLSEKETKIIEHQNRDERSWKKALEKCSVEEYKTYLKKNGNEYDVKRLKLEKGLTKIEVAALSRTVANKQKVDFFSVKTTKQILKADNYTCRRCGITEKEEKKLLHTHHIMVGGGEKFENGITLCRTCHLFIHMQRPKLLPKHKFTRETWDRYAKLYRINDIVLKNAKVKI